MGRASRLKKERKVELLRELRVDAMRCAGVLNGERCPNPATWNIVLEKHTALISKVTGKPAVEVREVDSRACDEHLLAMERAGRLKSKTPIERPLPALEDKTVTPPAAPASSAAVTPREPGLVKSTLLERKQRKRDMGWKPRGQHKGRGMFGPPR